MLEAWADQKRISRNCLRASWESACHLKGIQKSKEKSHAERID